MAFKPLVKTRFVAIVFLGLFLSGMAASPPLVGGPAPLFELDSLEGQIVKLSDLKGEFVVLNFWATWCVPCIKEMPELQKAHESLTANHVKIIGINFAESRNKVVEYTRENHLSFPVLLDGFGNVSQDYDVINLPVTYFISPDGIIREKIFGGGLTREIIESKIHQFAGLNP